MLFVNVRHYRNELNIHLQKILLITSLRYSKFCSKTIMETYNVQKKKQGIDNISHLFFEIIRIFIHLISL